MPVEEQYLLAGTASVANPTQPEQTVRTEVLRQHGWISEPPVSQFQPKSGVPDLITAGAWQIAPHGPAANVSGWRMAAGLDLRSIVDDLAAAIRSSGGSEDFRTAEPAERARRRQPPAERGTTRIEEDDSANSRAARDPESRAREHLLLGEPAAALKTRMRIENRARQQF